ncbi:hypothetical protein SODALDRAFT_360468 [Sodiomyces alkalinus F11]|uniref:Uncharacterized protein n=1 Tax=Sodiomyces alkalinus (strain CBS 110278 / VKM F-3762 / F11) TaxID=1314773 RepID=A0A3N2PUE3_SODAK|nr:hypothetical protein SODALDRAFT_360468 [Sodiomyces alkalinus F11]ROT38133.1 hypothetical protein SODALDRAFT_360468 [Sodiomyces alkalinus F11]
MGMILILTLLDHWLCKEPKMEGKRYAYFDFAQTDRLQRLSSSTPRDPERQDQLLALRGATRNHRVRIALVSQGAETIPMLH